jgi:16S rRNA (uracil1498-N3)-methyltransferase
MQLFYLPTLTAETKEFFFDKEESRHISKVLRKQEGEIIQLTNGKGCFFDAELIISNPKKCVGRLVKTVEIEPLPYHLHIAVAPTKLNDRFEWFLEKATEIGISEITPIICDHSERKTIKFERYDKILQSAMKQSLKAYLPKLNEAVSFKQFLSTGSFSEALMCIAHCEDSEKQTLKSFLTPRTSVLILIGPEGDFSSPEIELAEKNGFTPVSLGSARLRTETAALVACHSVHFVNED